MTNGDILVTSMEETGATFFANLLQTVIAAWTTLGLQQSELAAITFPQLALIHRTS